MPSIRDYCLDILNHGDLASKLRPPFADDGTPLTDDTPGPPMVLDLPVRDRSLRMQPSVGPLASLAELRRDPAARVICLERFAHHELMAIELFAWSLVTWPEMPAALRRSMLAVIADEQRHLQLYLDRLATLGSGLGQSPLSHYLWRHAPAIRDSGEGPLGFLCAMGLTFEQANLDFTLVYRDVMAQAGDHDSAAIMDRIHRDEIGHVRLALDWLRRLKRPPETDAEAYRRAVSFPLSAARAKGRRFDLAARKRAGFDDEFIALVRDARPYKDDDPSPPGQPPRE